MRKKMDMVTKMVTFRYSGHYVGLKLIKTVTFAYLVSKAIIFHQLKLQINDQMTKIDHVHFLSHGPVSLYFKFHVNLISIY